LSFDESVPQTASLPRSVAFLSSVSARFLVPLFSLVFCFPHLILLCSRQLQFTAFDVASFASLMRSFISCFGAAGLVCFLFQQLFGLFYSFCGGLLLFASCSFFVGVGDLACFSSPLVISSENYKQRAC
jgi:hypothetical protein